jgi:hypothetical protein
MFPHRFPNRQFGETDSLKNEEGNGGWESTLRDWMSYSHGQDRRDDFKHVPLIVLYQRDVVGPQDTEHGSSVPFVSLKPTISRLHNPKTYMMLIIESR